MSNDMIPSHAVPIWTPRDFQQTVDDAAEFEADMTYLRSLADALFEYAPAEYLMRIAAFDGDRA